MSLVLSEWQAKQCRRLKPSKINLTLLSGRPAAVVVVVDVEPAVQVDVEGCK